MGKILLACFSSVTLTFALHLGQNTLEAPKAAENATAAEVPPLFAIFVRTKAHYKSENLLLDAAGLICSARRFGSKIQMNLIYGGGLADTDLAFLRALGWTIQNHTDSTSLFQEVYKPVYDKRSASDLGRRWHAGNKVQPRKDGWATYFKFNAWKATQYDHVVVSDLDVCFTANPDKYLSNISPDEVFQATPEGYDRKGYTGINTHMMVLKPSMETYEALVNKARDGDYIPFTNTEQDILEEMYPAAQFATRGNAVQRVPHIHDQKHELCMTDCDAERFLKLSSPTCADFDSMCTTAPR